MMLKNTYKICLTALLTVIFVFYYVYKADPVQAEVRAGWFSQVNKEKALAGYALYGTKLSLAYNALYFSPGQATAYLDECAARGIKCWLGFRLEQWQNAGFTESDFRAAIKANRHHQALEGWYLSDEPEYGYTSPATVKRYYNVAKQEDPDHPVAIAHAWKVKDPWLGGPDCNFGCYDVVIMDVYPGWGSSNNDRNKFNSSVRDSYRYWRDGISKSHSANKTFVAAPLGFGYQKNGEFWNGVRDLDYEEYRYHVFTAIALGADDVLFWWDDWWNEGVEPTIERIIQEVESIGAEMGNGHTNGPTIGVDQPTSKVLYRYGTSGDGLVVLAVNISRWDASDNNGEKLRQVKFTLPGASELLEVEVLNENRTLPLNNGTFTDDFDRFEVHVYRIVDQKLASPNPPAHLRVLEY